MKALTLREPWGTAIAHLGKRIENRSWGTDYRGPLAIHNGGAYDEAGFTAIPEITGQALPPLTTSAFTCIVELVDVHLDDGCCEPWGAWTVPGAQTRVRHWELGDVVLLERPIPCAGQRSLWTPPPGIREELLAAWSARR